jgi:hypothetical protein
LKEFSPIKLIGLKSIGIYLNPILAGSTPWRLGVDLLPVGNMQQKKISVYQGYSDL